MLFQLIRFLTHLRGLSKEEYVYESERPSFEHQASLTPALRMRSIERKPDGRYVDAKMEKAWLEHVENEARADRHV